MDRLRDAVAYVYSNYPYKDELSNARVTKMVYLAIGDPPSPAAGN